MFRATTKVGWLPEVSGLTEAEAVAEYGAILCTICFPSAPVEWTRGKEDPNVCPGSGLTYDETKLTGRERMHYSPRGTCKGCGENVGISRLGTVRKHKVKGA